MDPSATPTAIVRSTARLFASAALAAALATPAHAALRIDIDPPNAVNPVRTSHTITATLLDGGRPVAGETLGFAIIDGPNAGATGTCEPADCVTDANGQVRFTWTDTAGPGVDEIRAFLDSNDNGDCDKDETQTICHKTWKAVATTTTCTVPSTTTTCRVTTTTKPSTTSTTRASTTTTPSSSSTTSLQSLPTTTATTSTSTTTLKSTTTTTSPSTTTSLASLPTTTVTTTTVPTTTTTIPGPFQCYEIKNFQFPRIRGVDVEDLFGSFTTDLERPHKLCAPASATGDGGGSRRRRGGGRVVALQADDSSTHLTAYPNEAEFDPVRNVQVTDAFGTLQLDVLAPDYLLVPSIKSLTGPPDDPPSSGTPYECYRVQRARGASRFVRVTGLTVEDQFGTFVTNVAEPRRLCAPANVNGEDPDAADQPGLMCYRLRTNANFGEVRVFLHDRFGQLSVLLIRRLELCVPATIDVP